MTKNDTATRFNVRRFQHVWTAAAILVAVMPSSPVRAWQVVREADPPEGAAAPAAEQPAEAAKPEEETKPASAESSTTGEEKKAEPEAEKSKTAKKAAGSTHTVAKGPFKVEVALDGVFEASQMNEIVLRPEAWTELTVVSAVEAGTAVKKGDLLIQFDTRQIDRAIRDLEQERELSYLAIKQAEDELKFAERESPLELEAAEQIAQMASQNLKNWQDLDHEYAEKSADFSLRSARQYLEYEEEELKQLEKMYAADDLTEETEEIILKRQRESVEFARFYFDRNKIEHARELSQDIPRRDLSYRLQARLAEILLARTQAAVPTTLGRKKLELAKLQYEQSKSDERLAKLQNDRGLLEVHAPSDGLVYYGGPVRGEWSQSQSMAQQLRRGGSVAAHQTIMTVVAPRPMFVRAKLPEKELSLVEVNQQGKAVPSGFADLKLPAAVSQISPIPVSEGQFDARVTADLGAGADALVPGMQCQVKLVPYVNADAIAVPSKAVFTDELDDSQRYVYVVDDEGEHARRDVTVGKASGDKSEIAAGLSAGEKILLEKPDPAKSEEK